jgi:D-sedoheptulose 7-phosphate isomerase
VLFFGNGGSAAERTAPQPPGACPAWLSLEALGRPGDVAVAFSTSGNSPSVVEGIRQARRSSLSTVAFTGRTGGKLAAIADVLIPIPSDSAASIQELHIVLGHLLCEEIEPGWVSMGDMHG